MAVVVVATITPLPEHRDVIRKTLLDTVPRVHDEPGCELYALHEGESAFVMIEQWADPGALAVHSRGAALADLTAALDGKLAGALDVTTMAALPAGEPVKGQLVG